MTSQQLQDTQTQNNDSRLNSSTPEETNPMSRIAGQRVTSLSHSQEHTSSNGQQQHENNPVDLPASHPASDHTPGVSMTSPSASALLEARTLISQSNSLGFNHSFQDPAQTHNHSAASRQEFGQGRTEGDLRVYDSTESVTPLENSAALYSSLIRQTTYNMYPGYATSPQSPSEG